MLSCQDVTRLVSDSLDRKLPLRVLVPLRMHLLLCKWCDRYRRQLLFLRDAIRRHPERLEGHEQPPSPPLPPEARERIKRSLAGED